MLASAGGVPWARALPTTRSDASPVRAGDRGKGLKCLFRQFRHAVGVPTSSGRDDSPRRARGAAMPFSREFPTTSGACTHPEAPGSQRGIAGASRREVAPHEGDLVHAKRSELSLGPRRESGRQDRVALGLADPSERHGPENGRPSRGKPSRASASSTLAASSTTSTASVTPAQITRARTGDGKARRPWSARWKAGPAVTAPARAVATAPRRSGSTPRET